jgi:hypothetical protein
MALDQSVRSELAAARALRGSEGAVTEWVLTRNRKKCRDSTRTTRFCAD